MEKTLRSPFEAQIPAAAQLVGDALGSTHAHGLKLEESTCAGNASTLALSTRSRRADRSGVLMHNPDSTYDLWVALRPNKLSSAPVLSSSSMKVVVNPGKTVDLRAGSDVELYVQNSSGAATTTSFAMQEYREGATADD